MHDVRRRAGASCLAALLLALGGCGSDPADSAPHEPVPTTSLEPGGPSASVPGVGGLSVVGPVRRPAATVALSAAGFTPSTVRLRAGDVVRVTAAGQGAFTVVVETLAVGTVGVGTDRYVRFDRAGTFRLREDTTHTEATVTVGAAAP